MAKRIVIVGAGFAGMAVARALERRRAADLDVTVVNRTNYMLFTPMLPEVSSGGVEPRHIARPLRYALRAATFELGDVRGIDFENRTVRIAVTPTGEERTVPFDTLVLALGAETSTHGIPGAEEHTYPLKTIENAIALREQTIRTLETADRDPEAGERRSLLTFVVVGGGFTGVEAAGELHGYLREILHAYPHVDPAAVRVVLVAGKTALLEQLPARFGDRAREMLQRRGVEMVFDDDVASVDAGGLTLKSGKRFESRTVVWSAGVRPNPLIETLAVEQSKHHAVVVNPDFSVPGHNGVWAIGDCAQIPKPGGGHFAQTAQDAIREGLHLARNILAVHHGKPTRPFRYRSLGMMASLGHREGLADIGRNRMIAGFPAWLLWRAYYLARLPGARQTTRVALDWLLSFPFSADIARVE